MKSQKYPFSEHSTAVFIARQWVEANRNVGAVCPCCGQLAKTYRRKLYSSMVYALILICRQPGRDFHHIPSLLNGHGTAARGGDFAKLVHWGLIESSGKDTGFYRATQKGRDFVECRIVVPEAVFIFDGECVGVDDTKVVSVIDALGTRFNYEELMGDLA